MKRAIFVAALAAAVCAPLAAQAPIKAQVPATITPAWNKGIQPISSESYYHAIECGKQGGTRPACVFYDADLCKNEDFTLSLYTPYKMVAYTVWQAVSRKQPAPQPSYAEAQRQRVVFGVTSVRGSQNRIADVTITRGTRKIEPVSRDTATGTFIFDFPAVAPSSAITINLVGKTRTQSCSVDRATLARFR